MALLKTENLCKVYNKDDCTIVALSNCNIKIEQGEFVVIKGMSGSGKSTLLRLLGGHSRPSAGKVLLNDRDLYSLQENEIARVFRQEIGFVSQDNKLLYGLTAYENMIMPSLLSQSKYDKDYFDQITEYLQLTNILYQHIEKITKEQQKCVAITRALLNKPSIIMVDDPTKYMREEIISKVLDVLMNSLRRFNQTLIVITHNTKISIFADRIINLSCEEVIAN